MEDEDVDVSGQLHLAFVAFATGEAFERNPRRLPSILSGGIFLPSPGAKVYSSLLRF